MPKHGHREIVVESDASKAAKAKKVMKQHAEMTQEGSRARGRPQPGDYRYDECSCGAILIGLESTMCGHCLRETDLSSRPLVAPSGEPSPKFLKCEKPFSIPGYRPMPGSVLEVTSAIQPLVSVLLESGACREASLDEYLRCRFPASAAAKSAKPRKRAASTP